MDHSQIQFLYTGFCWPNFVTGHFDLKCTKGQRHNNVHINMYRNCLELWISRILNELCPEIWVNCLKSVQNMFYQCWACQMENTSSHEWLKRMGFHIHDRHVSIIESSFNFSRPVRTSRRSLPSVCSVEPRWPPWIIPTSCDTSACSSWSIVSSKGLIHLNDIICRKMISCIAWIYYFEIYNFKIKCL